MNGIRLIIFVWLALVAVPLNAFAEQDALKQSFPDKTRVSRLEQEIKIVREMNESNLALIEKLKAASSDQAAMLETVQNQTEFQKKLLIVLASNKPKWTDIAIFAVAFLALIISVLAWRINKQIAWFTGAMESHSTTTLKLKAAENDKITMKWWDPFANGPKKQWPTEFLAKHDEKIELNTIYIGVPVQKRTKHSCFARLKVWGESIIDWIKVCAKGSTVKQQGTSEPPDGNKTA